MFSKFDLRWKTLIIMLLVALLPLIVSMMILSGVAQNQLRSSLVQVAEKAKSFVDLSAAGTQREMSNSVSLLGTTADLINAVYFTTLTQDPAQLSEYLETARSQYRLSALEVLDNQGKTLARAQGKDSGLAEPKPGEAADPAVVKLMQGSTKGGMLPYAGQMGNLALTPVQFQGQTIGYLVAIKLLDDDYAKQLRELSGVEVAFLGPKGVVGASHPDLRKLNVEKSFDGGSTIELGNVDYYPVVRELAGKEYRLLVAMDLSIEAVAVRSLRTLENPNLKGLLRRVIGKIFNDLEIKGWCKEFEAQRRGLPAAE